MQTKDLRLKRALWAALMLLLLGAAGTAKAQTFTVGNLNYSVNEGTQMVTLTGHVDGQNATGPLVIPDSVLYQGNYYAVTTIGNNAFYQCHGFSGSLSVPNSVTTIGNNAFYQCYGFTGSLTIGNSVTTIGRSAFEGCTGFTGSLTIPNSVTTIGNDAFYYCPGFTGSLTIGNSVTTIGNRAFKYCTGFTGSLTIPNSVTTIGEDAFYVCTGFTGSLTIPNSVTTIGNNAFEDCNGFTGSLTIPNSVTTIGNSAFEGCNGFTGSLTIPNSVTTIGSRAFYNCYGFTGSLVIPNSVTTIGNGAFVSCNGFTGSLTIPNSVTTIGEDVFCGCYGFTGSLVIPNSVTTIGSHAFRGCNGFTGSLTIGNSVTTIGGFAFYECTGFSGSLVIPNSVTTIGNHAFWGCNGFTGSLTIGNSVTTIGDFAFYQCTSFTSIESLAFAPPALGNYVFDGWDTTTPVNVPCGSSPAYSGWGGFSNIIDPCTIYVKEVMLLGGSSSEVNALLPVYQADGWHLINNDLNAGCGSGSDYIYLLYKSEASEGLNLGYVTGFYISNAGGTALDSLTYNDRLYHLVPYDGGSHFKNMKGDLNSNAGGAYIHLYFTKDYFLDNQTVTEITFNATQSDAVGVNGGTTGYDLNSGAGGDYIYMHVATEEALRPIQVSAVANPTEGGTVSGAGIYGLGTTCTLTATANEDYTFVNWTKDGQEVSTSPSYSFTVTEAAAFAANFEESSNNLISTFDIGWTWWSSCIETADTNVLVQLKEGLGANGLVIKSQTTSTMQLGNNWVGSLIMNNENGYMVKTNAEVAVEILGPVATPENHPITLTPDWTWIGYPCAETMTVEEALANHTPQANDVIKGQNASAMYMAGSWHGGLTLTPGIGLMYKSNSSSNKTLTFAAPTRMKEIEFIAPETHWKANYSAYPTNMTVLAVVELDGKELALRRAQGPVANYELASFANGECRGSVAMMYIEPLDRYMALLTISGEENDIFHFALYNTETGEECFNANETLTYETDAVIGNPDEPFVIRFRSTTSVDEWANSLQIFPNPVEHGQTITFGMAADMGEVQVEIINALGTVVETRRATSLQTITAPQVAGVYTLRITEEGKGTCYRKLVVR